MLGFFSAIGVVSLPAWGSTSFLYFNRIPSATAPADVFRVAADGSGEVQIPRVLPSLLNPTVSRNGRALLVTSPDPARPFKISNDVFLIDLVEGGVLRLTAYEDLVQFTGGILLTNNLGNVVGDRNVSGYSFDIPYNKVLSPDGSRVAVMNMRRAGSSTTDIPRTNTVGGAELFAGSSRFPILEVFGLGAPAPFGFSLMMGAERTGNNQGGDGVDWHPNREEVIGTFRSDIPVTGNSGISVSEGTVLAVLASGGLDPFIRLLTRPTGRWNTYSDGFNFFSILESEHDYAPAISPSGQWVAYVRHTQLTDTRFGVTPQQAVCDIRLVRYDGTGDHSLLVLARGFWCSKLAWAPDGSQIAFDISPQLVLSGIPVPMGDVTRSEIHVMGSDGSQPRRLITAPASYPSWAPAPVLPPSVPLALELTPLTNGSLRLRAQGGQQGRSIRFETSRNLKEWTVIHQQDQAAEGIQFQWQTPDQAPRFFRLVQP